MNNPDVVFSQLSDDDLVKVTFFHRERFNRFWSIVMRKHPKTGAYIDASYSMGCTYDVLGQLINYAKDCRSAAIYERVFAAAGEGIVN